MITIHSSWLQTRHCHPFVHSSSIWASWKRVWSTRLV